MTQPKISAFVPTYLELPKSKVKFDKYGIVKNPNVGRNGHQWKEKNIHSDDWAQTLRNAYAKIGIVDNTPVPTIDSVILQDRSNGAITRYGVK